MGQTKRNFLLISILAGEITCVGQAPGQTTILRTVSILLRLDVPSETVQIDYFMSGAFGGYGGNDGPIRPGLRSYEIPAFVDGKPASDFKIAIYAPGCQIETADIPLTGGRIVEHPFKCQRIRSTELAGQIPADAVGPRDEVAISYLAPWVSGNFFGIADGPTTEFQIATVPVNPAGMFRVDLSDLSAGPPNSYQGSWWLQLQDHSTGNRIADLRAPQDLADDLDLRVQPSYPGIVMFDAQH
jgi:hypothetical protein